MNRYLIHFSYLGSNFKGVVRVPPFYNFCDRSTIQGEIEKALMSMRFVTGVEIETSSRTDSGVHALHSTLHADITTKTDTPFPADYVTQRLNKRFQYTNMGIRILKTEAVDSAFHVRENVATRSYLYRLAVTRKSYGIRDAEWVTLFHPIEESDRCYFVANQNFDVDRMRRAAQMFVGKHDFRTFTRPSIIEKSKEAQWFVRKVKSLTIEEAKPACLTSERQAIAEDTYLFLNIRFQARSFLYRQVRKIVGALLAVAEGRLTEKDIYEMLTIPSHASWPFEHAFSAPANALFLTGVEYEDPVAENDSMTAEQNLDSDLECRKLNPIQASSEV